MSQSASSHTPHDNNDGARYGFDPYRFGLLALLVVAAVGFVLFVFVWFSCRIEPPSGHCAVLIRKDGTDIPANDIIATQPGQKGVQLEPLSEGRYFYNPINWAWQIVPLTHVNEGEVGVMVQQFGTPPTAGRYIVKRGEGFRGIIDEPLRPGTYRINPLAFAIEKQPAVKINPGEVGIVTLRYGPSPAAPNTILVQDGERGVQPAPLHPGTYYLNPYIQRVDIVSVQSHKTEFEISFLSKDGFRFPVKGTVEWAIDEQRAPEVFVLIGDENEIVTKVILRSALSMSRIQGSKYTSADVIAGTVRKAFQDEFNKHITAESVKKGVLVKAALISEIEPPTKISEPIRQREIAIQTSEKYLREIERAQTDANVAQQRKIQDQRVRIVSIETARTNAVQQVTKEQQVQIIGAQRDLEVARKDLTTAQNQALAVVAIGQGDADVISYTLHFSVLLLSAVSPRGKCKTFLRF